MIVSSLVPEEFSSSFSSPSSRRLPAFVCPVHPCLSHSFCPGPGSSIHAELDNISSLQIRLAVSDYRVKLLTSWKIHRLATRAQKKIRFSGPASPSGGEFSLHGNFSSSPTAFAALTNPLNDSSSSSSSFPTPSPASENFPLVRLDRAGPTAAVLCSRTKIRFFRTLARHFLCLSYLRRWKLRHFVISKLFVALRDFLEKIENFAKLFPLANEKEMPINGWKEKAEFLIKRARPVEGKISAPVEENSSDRPSPAPQRVLGDLIDHLKEFSPVARLALEDLRDRQESFKRLEAGFQARNQQLREATEEARRKIEETQEKRKKIREKFEAWRISEVSLAEELAAIEAERSWAASYERQLNIYYAGLLKDEAVGRIERRGRDSLSLALERMKRAAAEDFDSREIAWVGGEKGQPKDKNRTERKNRENQIIQEAARAFNKINKQGKIKEKTRKTSEKQPNFDGGTSEAPASADEIHRIQFLSIAQKPSLTERPAPSTPSTPYAARSGRGFSVHSALSLSTASRILQQQAALENPQAVNLYGGLTKNAQENFLSRILKSPLAAPEEKSQRPAKENAALRARVARARNGLKN